MFDVKEKRNRERESKKGGAPKKRENLSKRMIKKTVLSLPMFFRVKAGRISAIHFSQFVLQGIDGTWERHREREREKNDDM